MRCDEILDAIIDFIGCLRPSFVENDPEKKVKPSPPHRFLGALLFVLSVIHFSVWVMLKYNSCNQMALRRVLAEEEFPRWFKRFERKLETAGGTYFGGKEVKPYQDFVGYYAI